MSDAPTRRGETADWRDPWPSQGVRQGEPQPSPGVDSLRAEGFRVVFDVETVPEDGDRYQDHLNNGAPVRMFNELRMAYVAAHLAPDWARYVRRSSRTVVVRELHVQYESEGWLHEEFVGATRWAARRGKAGLVEQRLVEAASGRPFARAWVVQLLVGAEGVEHFPDWFWEAVAGIERGPIPEWPSDRRPWGPPA
ncbi:MAG: thioesterase family protein [Acidimicrobiia bacterium]